MQIIFGILYAFLFLSYLALGLFIIYHLLRYSFSKKTAFFGAMFFGIVLALLLFTNAFLFLTMPWGLLIPTSPSSPFGV